MEENHQQNCPLAPAVTWNQRIFCTHNTKCSSHTGFRVSGLTSVTWMDLAGNTSLVLERFSSFSFLFRKLNFRSFFSSISRGLWPIRIPSMQ